MGKQADLQETLHRRSLLGLPVIEWARQFQGGAVTLTGHVEGGVLPVGGRSLRVEQGPLRIEAEFRGGPTPVLERLVVVGQLRLGQRAGRRLVLHEQRMHLDGSAVDTPGAPLGAGALLAALVRRLGDVEATARGEPDGDVRVRLGHGIQVRIGDGVPLIIEGAARGPADGLCLCRPLEIRFGGDGIRLAHEQLGWLSRLARVRVEGARLHPDGSVDLRGGAVRGLDRAVQAGLTTASRRLSSLVRSSPGIRRFLRREV